VNKLTKKFLNSFRAGESGFTLIELLIVIAILGILAAVIIPNVSKFIGTSHVSAANSELAQVGTAAQAVAAAQTGGVFANAFLLDEANLGTAYNGAKFSDYISGTLKGEYWITINGSVMMASAGGYSGEAAATIATSSKAGDPWYNGLYWDETQAQFVGSVVTADTAATTAQGVSTGSSGANQPSGKP
jgi:type IV pilus assembly protein PilA